MSVMEFVLVAHAIIVGLAVGEVLRGFSELFRSNEVKVNYRLLLIAGWTLLLLLQLWWSIWRVGKHALWTFPQFIIFLFPVGILYVIARLSFPEVIAGTDLTAYYLSVARKIWWLVAATYASFALLMQPYIFGGIIPLAFASQITIAILALVASRVKSPGFHLFVIATMLAQVLWRGVTSVVGS